jgi:hypothetical protein
MISKYSKKESRSSRLSSLMFPSFSRHPLIHSRPLDEVADIFFRTFLTIQQCVHNLGPPSADAASSSRLETRLKTPAAAAGEISI